MARVVMFDGNAADVFEEGAKGSRSSAHAAATIPTTPMSIREFQRISGTTLHPVGNHIRNPALLSRN
jgi:hypothetical protein